MAISRAQLLKELLPGLNALFGLEYVVAFRLILRSVMGRTLSLHQ